MKRKHKKTPTHERLQRQLEDIVAKDKALSLLRLEKNALDKENAELRRQLAELKPAEQAGA